MTISISQLLQSAAGVMNEFSEKIFAPADSLIEKLMLPDWLSDALIDSFHLLPVLFLVFLFIEIIEFFSAGRINSIIKKYEFLAVPAGALSAVIPQCGMPVIAGALYLKKYISKGALIAVYLASSDEAAPVLMSNASAAGYIAPLIGLKIIIAFAAGMIIDFLLKKNRYVPEVHECSHHECEEEEGCCSHSVSNRRKRELIYHPLKHTLNVFIFILLITIILNYIFSIYDLAALFGRMGVFEPAVTALIGLIPNCAVSIALALMLIKGTISFGAAVSGLLAGTGLGILVLLRHKENIKDTMLIIGILLFISIVSGIIINASAPNF